MSHTDPAKYRSAADRCRTKSQLSEMSHEWILFAQDWERIAVMTETLSANKLRRAQDELNAPISLTKPTSCANPHGSLLLAEVFCSWRDPSFRCDPLSCERLS